MENLIDHYGKPEGGGDTFFGISGDISSPPYDRPSSVKVHMTSEDEEKPP